MQYSNYTYDYDTQADDAPWTAAPSDNASAGAQNFDAQIMPLTPNPLAPAAINAGAESFALSGVLQAMQQTQLQQMYVLRAMEMRLTRLEETMQNARAAQAQAAPAESFERATWWALWGLLMLILGGALAVIIVLILLNAQIL